MIVEISLNVPVGGKLNGVCDDVVTTLQSIGIGREHIRITDQSSVGIARIEVSNIPLELFPRMWEVPRVYSVMRRAE